MGRSTHSKANAYMAEDKSMELGSVLTFDGISLSLALPTITLLWVCTALSELRLLCSRAHHRLRILFVFLHEPATVNHPTDAAVPISNC